MINQGRRQALYLQDCQIPQNKFLRERAAVGWGMGKGKVYFLVTVTREWHLVGPCLPHAHTPLFLPEQETEPVRYFSWPLWKQKNGSFPRSLAFQESERSLAFWLWVLWAFPRMREREWEREERGRRKQAIPESPQPDLLFPGLS